MIRFAVPPIGGKGWFGGWMYMGNLVRTLAEHGDPDIETLLFVGPDRAGDPLIAELRDLPRTRVVVDAAFDEDRVRSGLARTVVTGRNAPLLAAFARERVDVAFAPALYLGWRSPVRSIAWFPDFQHRRLPQMFGRIAWWKRELGFRVQVAASDLILLSSADAEADCLRFYPNASGRTRVARFAVPVDGWPSADAAWALLRTRGLPEDFIFLPNQLWQHKNHALAVAAAAILARRSSTRRILMTGHGDDPRCPGHRPWLEQEIVRTGAGANIQMLGSVDYAQVQAMMVCAAALLNPSRFEGWSTTVEEAKAVGTPMLLSDLPVHREQAPDARFFGVDDAAATADAIASTPPRDLPRIRVANDEARRQTRFSQAGFANAVSEAVISAAHWNRARP